MNPEREVEIKLWDWLKCRSESVKKVYFNSRMKLVLMYFVLLVRLKQSQI